MHGSDIRAEAWGVCVFGDGDENLDVVGGAAAFELGFGLFVESRLGIEVCYTGWGYYLEHIFNSGSRVRFNHALHPDQRLHLCVQPVAHELEFAIRRDKTDCAVILEARESDTLVELHILHLD